MRPDQFIKCRPMEFEMAVKGKPTFIKWAYWVLLCHYRCHNHCKGLEDDDESLRKLCEIENKEEWLKAKPIIFGGFFSLDINGLWQNAVAAEDYREDCSTYDKFVRRGNAGANARWKRKKR